MKTNDIIFSQRPFVLTIDIMAYNSRAIIFTPIIPINQRRRAKSAFGKKSKGQEEFIRIVSEAVKLAAGFSLADMYPSSEVLKKISRMRIKAEKLHQASDRILENIVNEHKEKRNKMIEATSKEQAEGDLVEVLLKLREQGLS
ncbi:hypothetical protein DITRI_Ditri01bG0192500 [Diplodiscus trichospermus]